jgi:hypothetical protein
MSPRKVIILVKYTVTLSRDIFHDTDDICGRYIDITSKGPTEQAKVKIVTAKAIDLCSKLEWSRYRAFKAIRELELAHNSLSLRTWIFTLRAGS